MQNLIGTNTKSGCLIINFVSGTNNKTRIWMAKCLVCNYEFQCHEQNIKRGGKCYQCTNLAGKQINHWTVLHLDKDKTTNNSRYYICQCSCKSIKTIAMITLTNGTSKSCGCQSKLYKRLSLVKNKVNKDSRNTPIWKSLKRYIKQRENYSCYICDSNQNIDIHHLDSWKQFPDRRYDETNLVALCKFCHEDFHCKYGRETATKEMFFEHISGFKYEDEFLDEIYSYKIKNGFVHKKRNNFIRSQI